MRRAFRSVKLRRPSARALLLIVCLMVAFGLRAYGIGFGLPQLYYWDEPTVVNRAVRFATGDLNPHFYYYPAFFMYAVFAASGVYFAIGRALGSFHGALDFAATYFVDPTGVYLTARLTTVLFGTATVGVLYAVGKRFFDARVGLLAGAFLAISVLHVSHSHVAVTDTAHAFFICAAFLPLRQIVSRARRGDYLAAGLLIGLGVATKYLAVLVLSSLVVAHFLRDESWEERRRNLRLMTLDAFDPRLFMGLAAVALGFFVGSPYNIIDLGAFIEDFRKQMMLSAIVINGGPGFVFEALLADFGWPLCLLALLGLARILTSMTRAGAVLLAFPAVYFVFLLRVNNIWGRYLLPLTPFVAILAAYGCIVVYEWVRAGTRASVALVAAASLVVASASIPVWRAVSWDLMVARDTDSRTLALSWFERQVPSGTTVAVQSLYDRTFDNVPIVTDKTLERLERVLPAGGKFGRVRENVFRAWRARPVYRDVGWSDDTTILTSAGARYLVMTDLYTKPRPELRALLSNSRLVARFAPTLPPAVRTLPDKGVRLLPIVPPDITVYELSDGELAPPAGPSDLSPATDIVR